MDVSASGCLYEEASKVPTWPVSWNTARLCWSREICKGSTPFCAIVDLFHPGSLYWPLIGWKQRKETKTYKTKLGGWKHTWNQKENKQETWYIYLLSLTSCPISPKESSRNKNHRLEKKHIHHNKSDLSSRFLQQTLMLIQLHLQVRNGSSGWIYYLLQPFYFLTVFLNCFILLLLILLSLYLIVLILVSKCFVSLYLWL